MALQQGRSADVIRIRRHAVSGLLPARRVRAGGRPGRYRRVAPATLRQENPEGALTADAVIPISQMECHLLNNIGPKCICNGGKQFSYLVTEKFDPKSCCPVSPEYADTPYVGIDYMSVIKMHFGTKLPAGRFGGRIAHAPAILEDGGAQGEDGRDPGRIEWAERKTVVTCGDLPHFKGLMPSSAPVDIARKGGPHLPGPFLPSRDPDAILIFRKQRRASKLFLSSRDEIKEASGELSERGTRKLKANDRSTEENVIKQFRGDQSKVIEDSDGGEDSEDNIVHVSDQAVDNSSKDGADVVHGSGEIGDDSSDDGADDVHGSSEVENDNGEDNADDGHAAGEDGADVVHGSGEVTDDDVSEVEADDGYAAGKDDVVHASGEITDDSSEDEADDAHAAGEDGADVVRGSGEVMDDSSEDEADDAHAAGEDGADVVRGSGEVMDDSSEDEADDAHAAGEDGADVVHGSGEVTDDSEVEADDGYAAGKDDVVHASGEITDDSSEDEADDAHAAGKDDVVHASGEITDDSSEDEADDAHAAGEDGAVVVHGSGEITDDSSEDEADDAHAAGEDGAVVVHGSGEITDDSSEDEADDAHAAGEYGAGVVHGSGEDDSDEDDIDEADDVRVEAKVADDLPDDESNMQPNKSSVTHSNRKSAGIADYSHPEQRTRLSSKLSYGNNMKTADSIHLQSVSVSRSEQGSELLETTGDESLDLAMFREIKKVESNQLVLEELPEPPPYLKSVHSARRAKPAPVRKKIQRTKSATPKKSGSALKSSQVKQIFNRHAQVRVSKEALTDVEKCLDLYMDQVASDLGAYAAHAKRKTITRADMELLMKRQRLVTDTTSLNVLIEKHLPMECRKLLIPCAKSGNQIFHSLSRKLISEYANKVTWASKD
ncbi:unnamed protein product [Ranitomeya imitator]|uniref:CENP-T/Histone H4 histone fold domain-containing protein n=1 Tax=Ranitomeya imitator TaxID=111125 RepID=A0ABN9LGA5_9NEOB|nr:unnamed protein product [Ranitomeya imitator]